MTTSEDKLSEQYLAELSETTKEIVLKDPSKYTLYPNGVARETETGRLVKGSNLNRDGKAKLQKDLKNQLRKRFGADGFALVKKLHEIINYDYEEWLKEHPNTTYRKEKYPAHIRFKALELALHYMFGKPSDTLHVDQQVDMTIDTKMHRIAKLINENKSRLKVINGGADVITDID